MQGASAALPERRRILQEFTVPEGHELLDGSGTF
jgi:hypothetical protein